MSREILVGSELEEEGERKAGRRKGRGVRIRANGEERIIWRKREKKKLQ